MKALYRHCLLALFFAALLVALAACGSQSAPAPSAPLSSGGPTPAVAAPKAPATSSSPTSPSAGSTAGALFLDVTSPAEDGTLNAPDLPVEGKTIPGAVVSVDGELVKVDQDGTFSTQIKLDEGANDVEVTASDLQGNEKTVIHSIIFAP